MIVYSPAIDKTKSSAPVVGLCSPARHLAAELGTTSRGSDQAVAAAAARWRGSG